MYSFCCFFRKAFCPSLIGSLSFLLILKVAQPGPKLRFSTRRATLPFRVFTILTVFGQFDERALLSASFNCVSVRCLVFSTASGLKTFSKIALAGISSEGDRFRGPSLCSCRCLELVIQLLLDCPPSHAVLAFEHSEQSPL